jgi:CspA family cold shock protein
MSTKIAEAIVKFFRADKNYGILIVPGEDDVFIHQSVVVAADITRLWPGDEMTIEYKEGEKGFVTTRVCRYTPWFHRDDPSLMRSVPVLISGHIEYYDRAREFGWIKPDDGKKNIRFHLSRVYQGIPDELMVGKSVILLPDEKNDSTRALILKLTEEGSEIPLH